MEIYFYIYGTAQRQRHTRSQVSRLSLDCSILKPCHWIHAEIGVSSLKSLKHIPLAKSVSISRSRLTKKLLLELALYQAILMRVSLKTSTGTSEGQGISTKLSWYRVAMPYETKLVTYIYIYIYIFIYIYIYTSI